MPGSRPPRASPNPMPPGHYQIDSITPAASRSASKDRRRRHAGAPQPPSLPPPKRRRAAPHVPPPTGGLPDAARRAQGRSKARRLASSTVRPSRSTAKARGLASRTGNRPTITFPSQNAGRRPQRRPGKPDGPQASRPPVKSNKAVGREARQRLRAGPAAVNSGGHESRVVWRRLRAARAALFRRKGHASPMRPSSRPGTSHRLPSLPEQGSSVPPPTRRTCSPCRGR